MIRANTGWLSFLNTRFALALGVNTARMLPVEWGKRLAFFIADMLSSREKSRMVRAVCMNQWVVSQGRLSAVQLNQIVKDTFRHAAICLYDLFRNIESPRSVLDRIELTPGVERLIERGVKGAEGQVLVTAHMSNYDLVTLAAAPREMDMLMLTFPRPNAGYRAHNRVRSSTGLKTLPTSRQALREAIEHLRAGRSVVSALDRPLEDSNYLLNFFGRPAKLPVHHIYLALKAQVPVVPLVVLSLPGARYRIMAADPIPMTTHPNRKTEIILNAEKVLQAMENFIRIAPHQWSMFYPVWPEVEAELP